MAIINGNGRSNLLFGTFGRDEINGGGRNDALFGLIGSDLLRGGSGNDVIFAGSDDDRAYGGTGNDRMFGESGNDFLYGGRGNDWLLGGSGNDRVYGGRGDDFGHGGNGNDRLAGGHGSDRMYGGWGNDTLIYRAENNVGETDYYHGGSGRDRLVIRLTEEEAADAAIRADIAEYQEFLAARTRGDFTFESLGLTVNSIERLRVISPEPVDPVNSAPVVGGVADLGATLEDTDVTITVAQLLALISDADGDTLTVSDVVASVGDLTLVDGAYVYAPDADANGSVTFTYTVSDGTDSVAATAELDVTAVNDAPIAVDDAYTVSEDGELRFSPISNDLDVDGGALTFEVLDTTGLTGSLLLQQMTGELVYLPSEAAQALGVGETQKETFTYTVSDDDLTDTGSVTIIVNGENDGPEANDDGSVLDPEVILQPGDPLPVGISVDVRSTRSIDVLGNDTDIDTNDTLQIVSVTLDDALAARADVSIVGEGADQRIVFNPDEEVFFFNDDQPIPLGPPPPDFGEMDGDLIIPPDGMIPDGPILLFGESEMVQFEYTITDGTDFDTATVTLYVTDFGGEILT